MLKFAKRTSRKSDLQPPSKPIIAKRIGVIGAGPSGLATLKELKEHGHEVMAFEAQPGLGGVYAKSYEKLFLTTCHINISFGAYSNGHDLEPRMWSADEYVDYLKEYANNFGLLEKIRFSTRVHTMQKDERTGNWILEVSPVGEPEKLKRYEFDHIAICCGLNSAPIVPSFPGEDKFQGEIIHSSKFKNGEQFADTRTLLVGLGESGSDMALEIAKVAKASAISTRKGPGFVIPRYFGGAVTDLDTNRCYHAIPRFLGGSAIFRLKNYIENLYRVPEDDVAVLARAQEINKQRGAPWQNRFGTKNTAFIRAMLYHGTLYKPDISHFEKDHAVFEDNSTFKCDTVLYCTGFKPVLNFLEKFDPDLAHQASNSRTLYQRMFHPDWGSQIAWIGFVRPGIGNVPLCAEMQARYFALVVSGQRQLPAAEIMLADIATQADIDHNQFPEDAPRLGGLTDFMRFLVNMSEIIGCKPPLRRLFWTKPKIWAKVIFGPISGAQFRLSGPGAMPEHAQELLTKMPTMPKAVLAYEFAILITCKALAMLGLSKFRPIGF